MIDKLLNISNILLQILNLHQCEITIHILSKNQTQNDFRFISDRDRSIACKRHKNFNYKTIKVNTINKNYFDVTATKCEYKTNMCSCQK